MDNHEEETLYIKQNFKLYIASKKYKYQSIKFLPNPTPLYLAAENGNLREVKRLLENGAMVNLAGKDGNTPLHGACRGGYMEVIELLLEYGAVADATNNVRESPLFSAVEYGHIEVVKLLLALGVRGDWANIKNRTPLSTASFKGNLEVVKMILDTGSNVDSGASLFKGELISTWMSTPPLYCAARNGHVEILKLLVERGAIVRHSGALYPAARFLHMEVVEILLANGASIDYYKPARTRHLVLYGSVLTGNLKILKHLLTKYPKVCIDIAARFLHLQIVEDWQGIIHKAASNIRAELSSDVLSCLVQNGAEWGKPCNALHAAVSHGNAHNIWILALHGAETTIPHKYNSAPPTVWDLAEARGAGKPIREALLHFWTPKSHKYHPTWTKVAIKSTLLVAKRQRWPFDQMLMCRILSFVAFGWYAPSYIVSATSTQ